VEIQMRRPFLTTFLLATTLLAGCGSDTSTGPKKAAIVGTWNLQSINGQALPFLASASDPQIEILGDQIVVSADGTFTDALAVRVTDGTDVVTSTIDDNGTYTVNGTAVEFVFSDNSSGTASVTGDTFTVGESGFSWLYERE
jgi:hypothetical protein